MVAMLTGTVKVLEQALRLADKRNTVAHNPMQVQVFEHSKTCEVLFKQAITSETAGDYIDDAELAELRAEAEDLVTKLYLALGYVGPRERPE
jgi:bisphosphoglycerate-independent phosphoglycerate mutase (AlkP superfamily)